ncbi:MAG TPA: rhodanese-like domain-containing protein [Thermoanaerobaculia bacterium]|jgi:rhodanese-related sulfurtransferase|nr:rhodanese-like domain-containing protein [Thermoanaerobaculia bacterium]
MRKLTILSLATLLVAGAAGAQYKPKSATPPPSNPQTMTPGAQGAPPSLDKARRIKRDEAIRLSEAGKAIFVDVRSEETFKKGHIKGAMSIPFSQLALRLRELPPGKTVITYCACPAEHTAALAVLGLNAHKLNNAAALVGGWDEWVGAGEPVETGK